MRKNKRDEVVMGQGHIKGGELIETHSRLVPQSQLTSECWTVQAFGLESCHGCEYKNTRECGGKNIRKTGKNANGRAVPLGREA